MGALAGRSPRRVLATLVLVGAAVGLVVVGVRAASDEMIYYRTPSEVRQQGLVDGVVRVGGLVVEGSMQRSGRASTLVLTDGVNDVSVHYEGSFPSVVQEGEGAVVEGTWSTRGVLLGREVLLRHSNEYRPSEAGSE